MESSQAVMSYLANLPKSLRDEWCFSVTCVKIAAQIRYIRRQKGWTSVRLAKESGLSMATVLRMQKISGLGIRHLNMSTLTKIAAAFDCALIVKFVSHGEWITWILTPFGTIASFSEEIKCLS